MPEAAQLWALRADRRSGEVIGTPPAGLTSGCQNRARPEQGTRGSESFRARAHTSLPGHNAHRAEF
eukprot:12750245-Alexandrium_andersonii.AAC.1